MRLTKWIHQELGSVVEELATQQQDDRAVNLKEGLNLSGRRAVYEVLDDLLAALFPGCHGNEPVDDRDLILFLGDRLRDAASKLSKQVERALHYLCARRGQCDPSKCTCADRAADAVIHLLKELPAIRRMLLTDIQAAYEGDPAALSYDVIVMAYPCVEVIATHRLAHILYKEEVPLIPRIMAERAHSRTGVDIHPGATIGERFFIDHGTGVVIGETSHIGKNVKIYQGVTLGALSFPKDEHGLPIKGIKRHPNIEDDVVIYAGATILGGETKIGRGSVIGGNVWLTHSVPPESKVYNDQPGLKIQSGSKSESKSGPKTGSGSNPNNKTP